MNKEKLIHQLFIGKVAEILGFEKTSGLLKEAKDAIEPLSEERKLPIADVVGRSEQLKCECKQATFTRTVDKDFNHMCGKCGRTL